MNTIQSVETKPEAKPIDLDFELDPSLPRLTTTEFEMLTEEDFVDYPIVKAQDIAAYATRLLLDMHSYTPARLNLVLWAADVKYYEHTLLVISEVDSYNRSEDSLINPAIDHELALNAARGNPEGAISAISDLPTFIIRPLVQRVSLMTEAEIATWWNTKDYFKNSKTGDTLPIADGYIPKYEQMTPEMIKSAKKHFGLISKSGKTVKLPYKMTRIHEVIHYISMLTDVVPKVPPIPLPMVERILYLADILRTADISKSMTGYYTYTRTPIGASITNDESPSIITSAAHQVVQNLEEVAKLLPPSSHTPLHLLEMGYPKSLTEQDKAALEIIYKMLTKTPRKDSFAEIDELYANTKVEEQIDIRDYSKYPNLVAKLRDLTEIPAGYFE